MLEDGRAWSEEEEPASEHASLLHPAAHKRLEYGRGGRASLNFISVATIAYFSVSGGPFGLEEAISAAGPAAVISLLLLFPLTWSLPIALMTAELSSALPSRAGYIHWVARGIGPATGAINGWVSLLSSVVDSCARS